MADNLNRGELEPLLESYAPPLPPFELYDPVQNKRLECLRRLIEQFKAHRAAAESPADAPRLRR